MKSDSDQFHDSLSWREKANYKMIKLDGGRELCGLSLPSLRLYHIPSSLVAGRYKTDIKPKHPPFFITIPNSTHLHI